jgi:hypothetical protein
MSNRNPILQVYGPLYALSSRGLHVRESARSWKLVVAMPAELLEHVRVICEQVDPEEAATLLAMLDRLVRRAEPPRGLRVSLESRAQPATTLARLRIAGGSDVCC